MKLNKEQRKNLAKTIFDCSKIVFAVAIVTPLVSQKLSLLVVVPGILTFVIFLFIGIILEKGE